MNIKKCLKKESQKDLRSIQTETDKEFLQRVENLVEEENTLKRKCKKNYKFLWAIPPVLSACLVATILVVVLIPKDNGNIDDIKYNENDFVQINSDFAGLTGALKYLTLNVAEEKITYIEKTYDSLSGDELYYTLRIDENSMEAYYSTELMIVVNENYHYDGFNFHDEIIEETYSDFSIQYTQQKTFDVGLNLIQCRAEIKSKKYEIYVLNYEEYSVEDGMFLTVINTIFDFNE